MTNKELLSFLAKNDRKINRLYNELIDKLAEIGWRIEDIPDNEIFSFDRYPMASKEVARALNEATEKLVEHIQSGIKESMRLSFAATTSALGAYSIFSNPQLKSIRNTASEAFIESRMKPKDGLSLSQKVWNYASQTKSEFEMGMSEIIQKGLRSGASAEELGRMLRSRLNNPDMMYRRYHEKRADGSDKITWRKRIIDEDGKVRFVKGDLEKVGQGVYRSARKNARRLAATEINMAYEYADCIRYQSEPFVLGIRISLSGNHTLNGKPFYDICDELQGVYPKTFIFNGFHPLCRCIVTAVLCSKEEFERIVKLPPDQRGAYVSPNLIKEYPSNFENYVSENADKIERAAERGTLPYWVKDNAEVYNMVSNEKIPITTPLYKIKIAIEANPDVITEKLYRQGDRWLPARQVLHNQIIEDYIKGYTAKSDTIYMLGGAPANGKSTVVDSGLLPHPKGVMVIDADKVKAMLPEYRAMIGSGDKLLIEKAANFVHEESSLIGKMIQRRAFENNIATVIDGVNDGGIEKVEKKIRDLRKMSNKRVRADYVSLDTDLSLKLAKAREEKTGRSVPRRFIEDMNREISILVPKLIEKNIFDELYLWDTNINGTPRLILKMINGELSIENMELYQRFLDKAK